MIKAIIFDADGVVIMNGTRPSQQLEIVYGISKAVTSPFFEGDFQDCLTGKADLKEKLAEHVDKWGWQGSIDKLLDFWFECEREVNEKVVKTIQQLRTSGIKCYLATNQEKYRAEYMINKIGLGKSFDRVFSSAHLGHKKPDKEFFEIMYNQIENVKPNEIMFFDNEAENVAAAKKFGYKAKLFTNFDDFYTEIKELI